MHCFFHIGATGTEVHNFTCVYHNMEYVECKWKKDPKTPASSKQNLYFWYVYVHWKRESKAPNKACNVIEKKI